MTPESLTPPPWWPGALGALLDAYGLAEGVPQTPNPEPLDGLIRLILAQQNTWSVAQRQWEALRAAYPRWEVALTDEPEDVEAVLRAAGGGLARSKSRTIWSVLHRLAEGGGRPSLRLLQSLPVAEARAALEALPGVGQRTASLLLLFHLAKPAAAVDGNIERWLRRLEVVPPTWTAERQERWLEHILPLDTSLRAAVHRAGVRHGREICTRAAPRCPACPLREWCPSAAFFMDDS